MSESEKRIVALVEDVFFQEPIKTAGRALGYHVAFVQAAPADGDIVAYLVGQQPVLILVDLNEKAVDWRIWVSAAKRSPATRRIPIIAFGPHTQKDLFDQARKAGCDLVVSNGVFKSDIAGLIRTHARDDEEERATLVRQAAEPPSDLLLKGIHEFNAGEYFEQHETLEQAWRAEPGPIRQLYQGILQIGIAYYQIQRHNYTGALKMFQRAWQYLNVLPDISQGVDVKQLRTDARAAQAELARLGPERIASFNPVLFKPVQLANSDKRLETGN
jgi:predicted metal-dependent hydrolase